MVIYLVDYITVTEKLTREILLSTFIVDGHSGAIANLYPPLLSFLGLNWDVKVNKCPLDCD